MSVCVRLRVCACVRVSVQWGEESDLGANRCKQNVSKSKALGYPLPPRCNREGVWFGDGMHQTNIINMGEKGVSGGEQAHATGVQNRNQKLGVGCT